MLLFAGGHGGLQLTPAGSMKWGAGNFLVRTRQQFVDQGVAVIVVDAPSDRQSTPFLNGFRQTPGHVADVKAILAWARAKSKAPVWLIGTSRGTQSAAYLATELQGADAPDGIVLTSTVLADPRGRPVPAMPLERIQVPVLVVHHEQDGCFACLFSDVPQLMGRLTGTKRKELIAVKGGESRGDPCEAFSHHGYLGQEAEVVEKLVAWINTK
ncbi:alpha/beta hydrolase [Usitatibacter palustris]|uniref:alpha/beta hydrolase n=1 Tax=Usitatibacter palustris TaxID=2732487 RepID=UPI001FEAF339|nr:alpha/beta hydrolase [Usitatibacter palustris]